MFHARERTPPFGLYCKITTKTKTKRADRYVILLVIHCSCQAAVVDFTFTCTTHLFLMETAQARYNFQTKDLLTDLEQGPRLVALSKPIVPQLRRFSEYSSRSIRK